MQSPETNQPMLSPEGSYHNPLDGYLQAQQRLKQIFIYTLRSFYFNMAFILIFFGIQVYFLFSNFEIFQAIVLILIMISIILESRSYSFHRFLKTEELILTEQFIILVETGIVGISIYQILDGAIERDGPLLAWFQIVTLAILIIITIFKTVLVYYMSENFELVKQHVSLPSHENPSRTNQDFQGEILRY